MNKQKGFTLIELLVVIAIIGILSSVVLASLNSARTKGADAAIKSNLQAVRAQAEIWYDNNTNKYSTSGTAVTACSSATTNMFSDASIINAIGQINTQSGGTTTCAVDATGQKWAISTPLRTSGTFCVDNSGAAKASSTAQAAGTCS